MVLSYRRNIPFEQLRPFVRLAFIVSSILALFSLVSPALVATQSQQWLLITGSLIGLLSAFHYPKQRKITIAHVGVIVASLLVLISIKGIMNA